MWQKKKIQLTSLFRNQESFNSMQLVPQAFVEVLMRVKLTAKIFHFSSFPCMQTFKNDLKLRSLKCSDQLDELPGLSHLENGDYYKKERTLSMDGLCHWEMGSFQRNETERSRVLAFQEENKEEERKVFFLNTSHLFLIIKKRN